MTPSRRSAVNVPQIRLTALLSMRNISQDALRRIRLPFPPSEVRQELIGRLEASFARADHIEAEAARAPTLLDRLEAAILTKAFKGELVPQDLNDEPASVLLERNFQSPSSRRSRLAHDDLRSYRQLGRHCEERQRRSNPFCPPGTMDCFASLAMTIQTHPSC